MPGRYYRISAAHGVRLHAWEDGYTVYHTGSGDTHLLDPFTGEVLSCLLRQPMDLDELARAITDRAFTELEPGERQALENALATLQRAHLAEPCLN